METISVLGIDLAKNVFQLCGVDNRGRVVWERKVRRSKLLVETANLKLDYIALEACSGAHHWGREFVKQGHEVRIISPQHVKPFVRSNKNDRNDAQAIVEASRRPNLHFVKVKDIHRQDIQSLHRFRAKVMTERTALGNEIRGLLHEYGIIFPQTMGQLMKGLVSLMETEALTPLMRSLINRSYQRLLSLNEEMNFLDRQIDTIFNSNDVCRRIEKIEGVGRLTATAIYAAVSDPKAFKNGRQFSAWLGLVPKQNSSGGTLRLLGISKRGDSYLRTLLVHGGRAAVRWSSGKTDGRSKWILEKHKERGYNRACVAVANKNARIIWAMMTNESEYKKAV